MRHNHGVSIHARAWRATSLTAAYDPLVRFQSTPNLAERCAVSIHARAWRATSSAQQISGILASFNPRPRMAGDLRAKSKTATLTEFQSTPAHGGRHAPEADADNTWEFQSTPAHGGRLVNDRRFQLCHLCFNPRPRMAGDTRSMLRPSLRSLFQSTPAHGGRRHPCLRLLR